MKEERSASRATDEGKAPTVSVIVPVYNVEKYLRQCLDSILAQTFTDFELLLIDDGSPDTSGAICDEYASRDPRVRVFHKENGGPSAARNLGLDHAQGEWICFVDADDYVDPDHLQNYMSAPDADIIYQGFKKVDGQSKLMKIKKLDEASANTQYAAMDVMGSIFDGNSISNAPWSKIFRRSIIEDNQIRFKLDMECGEDLIFNDEYLPHVHSLRVLPSYSYNYRTNPESITGHKYREPDEFIRMMNYCSIALKGLKLSESLEKFENKYITDTYVMIGRMIYWPFKLERKSKRLEYLALILNRHKLYPNDKSTAFCKNSVRQTDIYHLWCYFWDVIALVIKWKEMKTGIKRLGKFFIRDRGKQRALKKKIRWIKTCGKDDTIPDDLYI